MSTKKRRSDVTMEIVVGAFMFVILVILLTLSVVISQNRFFEQAYFLDVNFPSIGGLKTGEPVFLRGVRVGHVNEISVPERGRGVDLELRLTRPVELHEDYAFFIEPSSMLGGMRLVIEEGSETLPLLDNAAYDSLRGQPVANLMDEATQTVQMIRRALEEGGVLEDVQAFTTSIREITAKIESGEGNLARLINEEGLYAETEAMVANLRQSSEDVKQITSRLAEGRGMIGRLLSDDETLYNDLSETLANVNAASADARRIIARLEAGEGTLGKLLGSDDEVYSDLRDTVAALREFTQTLNAQEGTLGLLIREDVIYRKVEALLDEAKATLDDFRETSPITTFSSIFFGAF